MEKKLAIALAVLVFSLSLIPSAVQFASGEYAWSAPVSSAWKVGDTWFYDGAPLAPTAVLPTLGGIPVQRGIVDSSEFLAP